MQKDYKKQVLYGSFLCWAAVGVRRRNSRYKNWKRLDLRSQRHPKKEETKEKKSIYVYVCGAVMQAGVYELQQDSRVYEAIQKAGGFAENADISEINQAALLQDEEQIYVPAAGEVDHSLKEEGEAGDAGGKVNLNTATKEELMTLAGIGESKADSIIKYREEHGKFQSIEDIKQIEGIKDGVFQKIKDLITV